MIHQRLQRLRAKLDELNLPGLMVASPDNRRYLSGFAGSAGCLFISRDQALLVTDFRYVEQAGLQAPGFEVVRLDEDLSDHLAELVGRLGVSRLGFEAAHLTFGTHETLSGKANEAGLELVPTRNLVEDLRVVKEPAELAQIGEAVRLADEAVVAAIAGLEPGMTEREVAWGIERYIREHGGDGLSFDTIVAAGPHGALPHWHPSDHAIAAGEPVVLDLGARVGGYCSDLTRTVVVGPPDDQFRRVYEIVLSAQRAAEEAIKEDMPGKEADAIARQIITAAGHGDHFGHGLGHGVGLAVHEAPRLSRLSKDTLLEGTVVTVEPGIYLSGWGGVRIEDMVVVEGSGCRILSQAPKLEVP